MYQRFLRCVERLGYGVDVLAREELVAYAEAFQVFVTAELLVIVVADSGLEFCFVFRPHYGHGVAAEITARHGQYVRRGFVEQAAYQFAR